MKKRFIIGNLKMNLSSREEAEQYLAVLKRELIGKNHDHSEIVIAPPFVHLDRFQRELPRAIGLAAQDVFWERSGSYTGEVSASMLKDLGVAYAIVGHSERREYAKETDSEIAKKVHALLHVNISPILCIGETGAERRNGSISDVIERQLRESLSGVSPLQAEKIIIAYEPRWAIGTDDIPDPEDILQAKVIVYRTVASFHGASVADRIPVLYGGSVKTATLDQVCFKSQMDGVLVGRESLFPYEVVKMAERMEEFFNGSK